jgi:lysozyme
MNISQEGLSLIKKFEGCKLESYKCAAGVWTIGFGSTSGVEEGMEISQERADMLLLEDVEVFEEAVNNLVEVDLEQNQFDALVAWTFNLGSTNLKNSTLLKVLNDKNYEGVPEQIKRWNKATVDGERQVLEGLVRRREAESLLFTDEDWSKV